MSLPGQHESLVGLGQALWHSWKYLSVLTVSSSQFKVPLSRAVPCLRAFCLLPVAACSPGKALAALPTPAQLHAGEPDTSAGLKAPNCSFQHALTRPAKPSGLGVPTGVWPQQTKPTGRPYCS